MSTKRKKVSKGNRTEKEAVQVDAHVDADRLVTLTEVGEDRFTRTCKWVVDASKLSISLETWRRELYEMLLTVAKWSKENKDAVQLSYAAERDSQIGIYFVPKLGRYDFKLSDLLTELDIKLAEKHQQCQCDLFQQPESDAIERITALGSDVIIIYGEPTKPQPQMVA